VQDGQEVLQGPSLVCVWHHQRRQSRDGKIIGLGALPAWSDVRARGHGLHELPARTDLRVVLPNAPFHDLWCKLGDGSVPGGHADSFTTSIALHLWPDDVRVDRIPQARVPIDWDAQPLDFSAWSETGVIGDASHASAELGARLWHACVDEVSKMIAATARTL
jgi:creatinine amidohydrolase/Fe(II)-dependent formamide hydrolase-like protein